MLIHTATPDTTKLSRLCRVRFGGVNWIPDNSRLTPTENLKSDQFNTLVGTVQFIPTSSTSYETNPHVRLETSGGVLSTVDMVVKRRDGPRRLRELDDDDDEFIPPRQTRHRQDCLVVSGRAV